MSTISPDNSSQHNNSSPFLSRIASYVTYEEIYNSSISLNEIIALVRSLPLIFWCATASKSILILEYHEIEQKYQGILLRKLFPKKLFNKQIRIYGGKRVFFHRTQFLALLRLALLYSDTEESRSIEYNETTKDIIARCLLGISSLIQKDPAADYRPNFNIKLLNYKLTFNYRSPLTQLEKAYLMSFLIAYNNGIHDNFNHLIGRYKDMLLDIPKDINFKPEGVPKDIFTSALMQSTNLTVEEYAALTFGILVHYFPESNLLKNINNYPIDREIYFSKTCLKDKTFITSFFDELSLSISEFRRANLNEMDKQEYMLDFKTFMLKPLISLEDGINLYPCSIRYLQRLISLEDALYWITVNNKHSNDLRSYIGQVFEFYCRKICERIKSNAVIKPKFFPETEYGSENSRRMSCDAILVYDHAAVLMEFKIKNLKLQQTIIDRNYDSLIEDINMAFIKSESGDKAAKQIDETIKALKNGTLHLSGIDNQSIKYYYPIIITFPNWPLGPLIYDLIRRMISQAGLLKQSYCAQVEIWSCEELEHIETMLTNDKISTLDIPSIIKEKHISDYNNMNMYSFLWDKHHNIFKNNKYVTAKMNEMLDMIRSQFKLKE